MIDWGNFRNICKSAKLLKIKNNWGNFRNIYKSAKKIIHKEMGKYKQERRQ